MSETLVVEEVQEKVRQGRPILVDEMVCHDTLAGAIELTYGVKVTSFQPKKGFGPVPKGALVACIPVYLQHEKKPERMQVHFREV